MGINLPDECDVECDACGETATVSMSQFAGDPTSVGVDTSDLEQIGWLKDGDDCYCPECKEYHE